MVTARENTLVVDFSILPKRPEPSDVEKFMFGELKLDLADVTNIQFHNVKNVVYVEMVDAATAQQYHYDHHLRRVFRIDKKDFKVPVYVEDDAVNVRVHDLPPRTANAVLKAHMEQFGTILSICRETWRNYFPGIYNGVRVVRMKLAKPIPSYQTIDGELTLVTYRNQPKTCRFCERNSHPGQKCSSSGNKSTTATATTATDTIDAVSFTPTDFPSLGEEQQRQKKKQQQQQSVKSDRIIHQAQSSTTVNNASDVEAQHSDSDDHLTSNNKRKLSTKRDAKEGNELKRKNADLEHDQEKAQAVNEVLDNDESEISETSAVVSTVVTRSKIKQMGKK